VVSLVAANGTGRPALTVLWKDSHTLFATFDLTGLAPAPYDVRIDDQGQTVTAAAAFTVSKGNPGRVEVRLSSPSIIRTGGQGSLTVDYFNPGETDVPAPLLILKSDNARFQLPGQPDITNDIIRLLAINRSGLAGVLPPGYHDTITINFLPKTIGSQVKSSFSLEVFTGSNSPFPWDQVASEGAPDGASSASWSTLVAQAQTSIGSSWNDVLGFIRQSGSRQERITSFDAFLRYIIGLYGSGYVSNTPSGSLAFSFAPVPTPMAPISSSQPSSAGTLTPLDNSSMTMTCDGPPRAEPPNDPDDNLGKYGWSLVGPSGPKGEFDLWVYGQWDPEADVTIFVSNGAKGYDPRYTGLGLAELQAAQLRGLKVNLVYGDWSGESSVFNPNIFGAARYFADMLQTLPNFQPSRVWGVGESYAPYVMATMGDIFNAERHGKLGYIVGADPANQTFVPQDAVTDLTKGANLSVAIHALGTDNDPHAGGDIHMLDFAGTSAKVATYDLFLTTPFSSTSVDAHQYVDKVFLCNEAANGDISWQDPQQVMQKGLQKDGGSIDPTTGAYSPPESSSGSNRPIPPIPGDIDPTAGTTGAIAGGTAVTVQVTAIDPNDITGPAGVGAGGFLLPDQTLVYTIHFENEPAATAPAQQVIVTEQLDPGLDFHSFQVGDFTFGNVAVHVPDNQGFYNTRLDLRASLGLFVDVSAGIDVNTGVATWTFTSLDPATLDLPADLLSGFLPPNATPPQGEAFVNYTVRPRPTDGTGTRLDALASIVFDNNAPVATPMILNTIDAGPPASSVNPLPAVTSLQTFPVSWSGADDPDGSGIASFDVYASVDGGAFTPWLTGTTLTAAAYPGSFGHRYAFYSVATDNVGHRQATPAAAQASTLLVLPQLDLPHDITAQVQVKKGKARKSGTHVTQTVTVTNVSGPGLIGPVFLLLSGLPRKVQLVNRTGVTTHLAGQLPFLMANSPFPGRSSLTFSLTFRVPVGQRLRFGTRLFEGIGTL
jgi:uncharacterized repeat protein (TIGR01451 family)